MFNDDTLFYLANSLVLARVIIETLVEERNDLSPLCAVGKSITDLERFEKIVNELAAADLNSDYAKIKTTESTANWHNLKNSYLLKVDNRLPPTLLFLSAALGSGLFAVTAVEANLSKLNNAAANDVLSYSKLIFGNIAEEIGKAGRTYFSH